MKNVRKIVISTVLVAALASCDFNFSSGTSEQALPVNEANTRLMMSAMFNMMDMTEGSFEIQLDVDTKVDTSFEIEDNDLEIENRYNGGEMQGSVNLKVSDIWGSDPKAAVTVDVEKFSMYGHRQLNDEELQVEIEVDVEDESAAAYYHDEHVYFDVSEAPSLVDLLSELTEGDFSEIVKFGAFVGPILDEIPDLTDETVKSEFFPDSEEIDELIDAMVPIMMMMPNATIGQVGNEMRFVYTLTQSDLPALVRDFLIMMFEIDESELTASDNAEIDAEISEMLEVIDLDLFRFEVRIDTVRNIMNFFKVNVDLTVTREETWEYWDHNISDYVALSEVEIIDVDAEVILQILKFSEPVVIVLPEDLDDYLIINAEE
jgi:hypothetical protein